MTRFLFAILTVFFVSFLNPLIGELQLEYRTAAFFPFSHRFRDLYGNVGTNYQIEARTTNCFETCGCTCFETWANLDYFSKQGRSNHCCKSRVDILNVSLGMNYVLPICYYLDAYAGIGGCVARVELKNKSCCFHEKNYKNPAGILVKTGLRYYIETYCFLDFFADYLYQPVRYHHRVDIGGFRTGVGIGIRL